jgi:hypothetical protein
LTLEGFPVIGTRLALRKSVETAAAIADGLAAAHGKGIVHRLGHGMPKMAS